MMMMMIILIIIIINIIIGIEIVIKHYVKFRLNKFFLFWIQEKTAMFSAPLTFSKKLL